MSFFKDHSYNIIKLFLNQLGVTVFGTILTIATYENSTLLLLSSLLSVGLYLYLNYTVCWEIGAKDKIKIDGGRLTYAPATGFLIALIANIPNLLLSLLVGLGILIDTTWSANMSFICNAILRLLNGMYQGLIKLIGDSLYETVLIENTWWWFIVSVIPVIIACGIAYFLGVKNIRVLAKLGVNPSAVGKKRK